MNMRKLLAITSTLALLLVGNAAKAATIDDTPTFETISSSSLSDSKIYVQDQSVALGDGKQLNLASSYDLNTNAGVVALTQNDDGTLTENPVWASKDAGVAVVGLSLIQSTSLKKFVAAWTTLGFNDLTSFSTSVMFSTSTNGKTWSTPKAMLPARIDPISDGTKLNLPGYLQVQLFQNGTKLGALLTAKPDNKATSVIGIQTVSTADGKTWTKGKQVNSDKTTPLSNANVKLLQLKNSTVAMWTSVNANGEWSLNQATAPASSTAFAAPTAVVTKQTQDINYSVAQNSKDEIALTFITKADTDPNTYAAEIKRSAKGVWPAITKATKVAVDGSDVLATATALTVDGKALVATVSDDGSTYLNLTAQRIATNGTLDGDPMTLVDHAALGGQVLKAYYASSGEFNVFFDQYSGNPLDILDEEVGVADALNWIQGNNDGPLTPVEITPGDQAIMALNISVSAFNDFTLTALSSDLVHTALTMQYMHEGWAPEWNPDSMPVQSPTYDDAASVKLKGGKVTLTLPDSVKGAPTPTVTYAWYTCTKKVAADATSLPKACTVNKKATKLTYTASAADKGKYIVAEVTASNGVGEITWISQSSGVVK